MKIANLREGDRKVNVDGEIIEMGPIREVRGRYDEQTYTIADAVLEDETGSISFPLWNDQNRMVNVGDRVRVENGYVKSFRDTLQLNVGKYGSLTVI